ncbi:unnamed protein product [Ilex paraguariensis]|uniref:Uncharacterized protein n=1 Tax=Ilex paraguariensis TaxID=185542 RepID=A0ABC8T4F5_9AQUA
MAIGLLGIHLLEFCENKFYGDQPFTGLVEIYWVSGLAHLRIADHIVKEEAHFLLVAMGHETESIDEFVEAHRTCLNDIMYFPTRNAYGLSSVAGNMDKLAALQYEFENVKRRMDDDNKKALRLEQKIKLLTNGYQIRAGKLWSQIEVTFRQMDTAGAELECFQALQKQEHLAAAHRINGLWEEVQKQKELEQTLQKRYGHLLAEQERIQQLMDEYRIQAQRKEEISEKIHALELAEAAANKIVVSSNENLEPVAASDVLGNAMAVDPSHNDTSSQQIDAAQEQAHVGPKHGMDVNVVDGKANLPMDDVFHTTPSAARGPSLANEQSAKPVCNSSEGFDSADNSQFSGADGNELIKVLGQTPLGKGDTPSDIVDSQEDKRIRDSSGILDESLGSSEDFREDMAMEDEQNVVEVSVVDGVLTNPEGIVQETAEVCYANGEIVQISEVPEEMINLEA